MKRCVAHLLLLLAWTAPGFAQDTAGSDAVLSSRAEAIDHYAAQERTAWRVNAEKLAAIDRTYSEAVTRLSEENARRLQAIFTDNMAAHKDLSTQQLSQSEHATEYDRIQTETKQARADLLAWYQENSKALRDEHVARRAAQAAATNELVAQLGQQRVATMQRLLNGPVHLSSLPALQMEPPAGQVVEGGGQDSAVTGGGIDVAGTVDIDTPGDELVAHADADRRRLRERLFYEEVERRRQAEEDAARRERERRMGWATGFNDQIDYSSLDCDDSDRSVHPGATEVCNYIDDNCDGDVDEDLLAIKYLDRDGDLHGDPGSSVAVCEQTHSTSPDPGAGDFLAPIGNDCDDTDPDVWHNCGATAP